MQRHTMRRFLFSSNVRDVWAGCAIPAVLLTAILLPPLLTAQDAATKADAKPRIGQVFFAQRHVQLPDSPYFKLVGNFETLLKVQIDGRRGSRAPEAIAKLTLGSKSEQLPLKGPGNLPGPIAGDPVMMEQKYEDSYTTFIPKEWVKTGLKVSIELREPASSGGGLVVDSKAFDQLNIGAPTHLMMWMFDFHFFNQKEDADYPAGWFEEFASKLPVAELEMRRVRKIMLDKVVMPPDAGNPAACYSARPDGFNNELTAAGYWNGALKDAAGAHWGGTRRLYYANLYGIPGKGEGGGLSGKGNGQQVGILFHEMGHAFGLPHCDMDKNYPYVGPMHGIQEEPERAHVGPVWAFDPIRRAFVSPLDEGHFRNDPMAGGGRNRAGGPYLLTTFSDYSYHRIQSCFEKTQVVWDEQQGAYMEWQQETGGYTQRARQRGGPSCPIEDDIDVISVLASASLVTPAADIVYPPIGPYKSGRIEIFDAASPESRAKARGFKYDDSNCNLCLRVTQGGKTTTYLVNSKLQPGGDPKDPKTYDAFAINLPARDGEVTQADLLHTPGVLSKGLESKPKVLYSWKGPPHKTEYVTALYPASAVSVATTSSGNAPSSGTVAFPVPAVASPSPEKPSELAVAAVLVAEAQAASTPRVNVPEALRAAWMEKLRQRIAASAKASQPLKGWLDIQGKAAKYPLLGADEKQLLVKVDGNVMPMPWNWLKEKDVLALVKSLAQDDDAESQLMLSVFLLADGQKDAGETALARATLLDATAANAVREQLK